MKNLKGAFNDLVESMKRYDLYQVGDEVGMELDNLSSIIDEVEKRMQCVTNTNKDIRTLVSKYEDVILYHSNNDFELLQRSVNDIDIAIDLNDAEPIENNWYSLFAEPMEESNLIWEKGTIIEWNESVKNYNAKGGARARVTEDYTTLSEMVNVEFLDDLSNGQVNGGYYGYMFKDEPIKETPPTSQCGNQDTFDKVKEVIQILKTLDNGDCVDGETMQYILEQVGMEGQILKQLVMENDYKVTKDLMREKFELDL
jgi:hypothetical protein